ncbi:SSU ribosomal protein S18P [Prauserella shujinwangii]|uniref:Small ribosomal subunit protein bS18 n=1 Tax=Prauserella shujinwangii TaxID=1453103 RepID=A0A2T0LPJ1_9PSEU|nr:30S ribosomal protein S18 [Prauserella shujinwangii]PRX45155.1 SSU ribosomal protein S18P [Prauserella shujinwangii]
MPKPYRPVRRKRNPLHAAGIEEVDWKDVALLRTFLSDRGKIRARRVTGLTPRQQREVAVAIKNAREMALLPYPTPKRGG